VSLDGVLDAAADVFAERGFVRARMSEVATRAGVATGSLYNVAASKEALFAATFVPREQRQDLALPLPDPGLERMQAVIARRLLEATRLPLHEQALPERSPTTSARSSGPARGAVRLDGRLLAAGRGGRADGRRTCRRSSTRSTTRAAGRSWRASRLPAVAGGGGQLRLAAEPALVARFVVESVAFWAYHRHQDPTFDVSDEQAREVCVNTLEAALIGEPSPRPEKGV
jgi:AcrR family transcriptional regulator